MTAFITPPLKWHGGKHYLAKRILALMPPHLHYVEPYAGGLAVLLAKDPEGVSEVVNDLNGMLTNFWRVLRDAGPFAAFVRRVEATPFGESLWKQAKDWLDAEKARTSVELASAFFIFCRQSLAGRMKSFTGITRTRTRRGMNNEVSAWLTAVEGLPAVHERLKRVLILNRDALEVITREDGPDTLFYLDPPYLHETRSSTGDYAHEMTREEHIDLLAVLPSLKGKVILSGYPSDLYGLALAGWRVHDFDLPNNAASGVNKRRMLERVWCNFDMPTRGNQLGGGK